MSPVQKLKIVYNDLNEAERQQFLEGLPPAALRAALAAQMPAHGGGVEREHAGDANGSHRENGRGELLPPDDRRSAPRRRENIVARIILPNNISTVNCRVVDVSETGCRLELQNSMELPEHFRIQFTLDGTIFSGRVAWRHLNTLGIELST